VHNPVLVSQYTQLSVFEPAMLQWPALDSAIDQAK
jgi:hypothetical protein